MPGSLERGAFVGGIVGFGPIDRCRSGRCSLKAVANDGGAAGGEFARGPPVGDEFVTAAVADHAAGGEHVVGWAGGEEAGSVGVVHRPVARHVEQRRRRGPSDCGDEQVTLDRGAVAQRHPLHPALRAGGGRDALTRSGVDDSGDRDAGGLQGLDGRVSGFVRREHHCSSSRLHAVHPDQPLDRTRCHHAGKIVALEHVRTLDRAGCNHEGLASP